MLIWNSSARFFRNGIRGGSISILSAHCVKRAGLTFHCSKVKLAYLNKEREGIENFAAIKKAYTVSLKLRKLETSFELNYVLCNAMPDLHQVNAKRGIVKIKFIYLFDLFVMMQTQHIACQT